MFNECLAPRLIPESSLSNRLFIRFQTKSEGPLATRSTRYLQPHRIKSTGFTFLFPTKRTGSYPQALITLWQESKSGSANQLILVECTSSIFKLCHALRIISKRYQLSGSSGGFAWRNFSASSSHSWMPGHCSGVCLSIRPFHRRHSKFRKPNRSILDVCSSGSFGWIRLK